MKKIFYYFISLSIIFCIMLINCNLTFATSNTKTKEFLNEYSEVLKNMSENSDCIKKDNNMITGFISTVKYNNKIKITLCENILKYGDDKEIQNLAKKLINNCMNDNNDIETMTQSINHVNCRANDKFYEEYSKQYSELIIELNSVAQDDNINVIFLKSYNKINEFEIKTLKTLSKYVKNRNVSKFSNIKKEKLEKENNYIKDLYKSVK